jgi:hypothetical protein
MNANVAKNSNTNWWNRGAAKPTASKIIETLGKVKFSPKTAIASGPEVQIPIRGFEELGARAFADEGMRTKLYHALATISIEIIGHHTALLHAEAQANLVGVSDEERGIRITGLDETDAAMLAEAIKAHLDDKRKQIAQTLP